MRRRSGAVGRVFRHEGQAMPRRMGDFLAGVLGDRVHVGGIKGVGIFDVDLLLPRLGLALGIFHRDAGAIQPVADRPHHRFLFGGAKDRVIGIETTKGLHVAVAARVQRVIALVEQIELQLGRHHRIEPQRLGAGDLAFQDGAGRMGDFGVVMIKHIAHHHRGAGQPRNPAYLRQVGFMHVIAIARRPTCRLVALHGFHLEVGRQQVVAAVGFDMAAVDEMRGMKPFAHQAALHVDKAGQNGIDLAPVHGFFQVINGNVGGHRFGL
jgi:hypothetical protein